MHAHTQMLHVPEIQMNCSCDTDPQQPGGNDGFALQYSVDPVHPLQ